MIEAPGRHAVSHKRRTRMIAILDMLAERGPSAIVDLERELSVSPATVRRDLAELEHQRLVLRTHGGAALVGARTELPLALRDTRSPAAKSAIAQHVARILPAERHAVALGGGSTTAAVVRALAGRRDLTVVTNSLTIAALASSHPQLTVIMTGGLVRPESLELVGVLAENALAAINVGTAVLGTDGISAAGGVTTHDETEARTNRAMITHAQRVIIVADGSKVGTLAFAKLADLAEIDVLVTDASADAAEVERIRSSGIEVVLADESLGSAAADRGEVI